MSLEEHQVGDIRHVDGLVSMCLGYRSYGGGSGILWATPAEAVEFTVHGRRTGYFYGMCQAVFPTKKSVLMLVVIGDTWGDFKSGNTIEILAENIGRYHKTDRVDDESLQKMAKQVELDVYSNHVFKNITLAEINLAFAKEHQELSIHFLGEKAYSKVQEIIGSYLKFHENLCAGKGDLYRQPSKKLLSSAKNVRSVISMDQKKSTVNSQELIPSNLSPSLSAAYGAVCGALVGDAAGGVLEFMGKKPSRHDIEHALNMPGGGVFKLAPGQITDDGELTLCLLRALADREGQYDANLVARYYIDWAHSDPFDMGVATGNALRVHGYGLHAV